MYSDSSPVQVTTIFGYDGLILDKAIREKEQRIAELQLEIEAKKLQLEKMIEVLEKETRQDAEARSR